LTGDVLTVSNEHEIWGSYETPHAVWCALRKALKPESRKVLDDYRDEVWVHTQLASAPPLTVRQMQALRRVKADLTRMARERMQKELDEGERP
jgi:hypothetical protein